MKIIYSMFPLLTIIFITLCDTRAEEFDFPLIFINEFHYDNIFTDVDEFIEIAAPIGVNLDGFKIHVYEDDILSYSLNLFGDVTNEFDGYGFGVFDIFLPNGRTGIALQDSSDKILEFISYEGEVVAVDGPAENMKSFQIGVSQESNGDSGISLYRTGSGCIDQLFVASIEWAGPDPDTRGRSNIGQTFLTCPEQPSAAPSVEPSISLSPSAALSSTPTFFPSIAPSIGPTSVPSVEPTLIPSTEPTISSEPTASSQPSTSNIPSLSPTISRPPSAMPSITSLPTMTGSEVPSRTGAPTRSFMSICHENIAIVDLRNNVDFFKNSEVSVCGAYVTAISNDGLFIQDGNTNSSAIFVSTIEKPMTASSSYSISVGNQIDIEGILIRHQGNIQINEIRMNIFEDSFEWEETVIQIPANNFVFKRVHNMVVKVEPVPGQVLAISDNVHLDTLGEITVCAVDPISKRLYHFTQFNRPSQEKYQEHVLNIGNSCVNVGDNSKDENPHKEGVFIGGIYPVTPDSVYRTGTIVTNLEGPIYKRSQDSVLETLHTYDLLFNSSTNVRQKVPSLPSTSETQIALVNLNEFWTMIASDFESNEFGANSESEFKRQVDKTVLAINQIDASIYALVKLEQGEISSAYLRNQLNEAGTKTLQSALIMSGFTTIGDNPFKCDVFYDTAKYDFVNASVLTDESIDVSASTTDYIFKGTNLSPFAVSLREKLNNAVVTIVVNHFKSRDNFDQDAIKGDDDRNNGAGYNNLMRTISAQQLVQWVANDDFFKQSTTTIITGNLNSYRKETPIQTIEETLFANVFSDDSDFEYTFASDRQFGTLDYAFILQTDILYVSDAAVWHVNVDEPDLIDYNLDLDRNPAYFDPSIPERFSDHDVIMFSLDLSISNPSSLPSSRPSTSFPTHFPFTNFPSKIPSSVPTLNPIPPTLTTIFSTTAAGLVGVGVATGCLADYYFGPKTEEPSSSPSGLLFTFDDPLEPPTICQEVRAILDFVQAEGVKGVLKFVTDLLLIVLTEPSNAPSTEPSGSEFEPWFPEPEQTETIFDILSNFFRLLLQC